MSAAPIDAAHLSVTRTLRTLLSLCALAAFAGLAVTGPAAAASPCWKTLINDWYDGRIDGTYAIPCYRQALSHLPPDVGEYSSAAEDIRRALSERIHGKKPGAIVTPTGTTGKGGTVTGGTSGPSGPTSGHKTGSGPINDVINAGNSHHADSVPIPLLVLASFRGSA